MDIFARNASSANHQIHLWFFSGTKQEVELYFRASVICIALVFLFVFDLVELHGPIRSMLKFRKCYLEEKCQVWRERLPENVRINIMYGRRKWYFLWLLRVFEWTWNDGFSHPNKHIDANMWICELQGVCGKAFRSKQPHAAFFDDDVKLGFWQKWFLMNKYRMTGWQVDKTLHLKGVISIPILEPTDSLSPSYTCVGVINLDSSSEAGMRTLMENQDALVDYFIPVGKILATMRI